jgi:hypothetical protein
MSAPDASPLQDVLAAVHAVVYGYGVAGARLRGRERARAVRRWNRHRADRDQLATLLTGAGHQPAQSAAAYRLPFPVGGPADARELVILLEERLASVWADAVAALEGDLRDRAVEGLRDAAVAGARWRRASVAFPGIGERAG